MPAVEDLALEIRLNTNIPRLPGFRGEPDFPNR
jgi:hypothetical protein